MESRESRARSTGAILFRRKVNGGKLACRSAIYLQKVPGRSPKHLENLVVAGILAELEEHPAEQLEDFVRWNVCKISRNILDTIDVPWNLIFRV